MRWEDERYVRVYTRDTAEWLALGWEGQALAMMLLRKCDRAGIVHIGKAGVRGLAALVGVPLEVVERTLPLLLEDGMLQATSGGYVFPNFIAAQETRSSDAQRKRDQRERDRDQAVAGGAKGNKSGLDIQATMSRQAVTPGGHHMESPIASQPDVTSGHQQASPAVTSSHAGTVTPCCAVPSRAVPTSLAGSEARPPVSDNSADDLPQADPDDVTEEPAEAFVHIGPKSSAVPNGSGNHPAKPESSPTRMRQDAWPVLQAQVATTPKRSPAAKAARTRKPSAAEGLYAKLEETRKARCLEAGAEFVPENWAPARQNAALGPVAKLEKASQERFEAAWAEYLSDERGAARDPPWSLGWFMASRATWESKALRGAS